jgi:hypothetical protein
MSKEEIKQVALYAYPKKIESFCGCSYDANEASRNAYAKCLEDVFIKKMYL